MKMSPGLIKGPWRVGYTLDDHTTSSQYLGDDPNGHPQFDTVRSDLGEQLYQLKYRSEKSAARVLANAAVAFLRSKCITADVVVPIPPSKARSYQPLRVIAAAVAKQLGIGYDDLSIAKVKETPELKSIEDLDSRERLLSDAFAVQGSALVGKHVLLLDDLYRSGATMRAVARTLQSKAQVASIVALALTRTRTRR